MYTIYGKPNCPFCEKAKMLLSLKNKEFNYLSLDEDFTRDDLLDVCRPFRVLPKTMPQIFFKEEESVKYIGGFDQLEKQL